VTPDDYLWIGVWLFVGSVILIVVEMAVGGILTARVARRAKALSERLSSEQAMLQKDVAKMRESIEEMQRLWRPYARVLRWLRHPLVVALGESYSRRRSAAR